MNPADGNPWRLEWTAGTRRAVIAPVLRDAAEVDPRAGVHHDLRRVEASGLEVVDEALAHEIALASRHDR
jgi:hypothetical protein